MTDLNNAHVLVVGATGGLGSALARALAEHGAALTISGRTPERVDALAAELGDAVVAAIPGDLVDPSFPDKLVTQARVARPLTGVVFAAGVVAFGDAVDLDDDVLDQLMLLNLIAPIRLARAAAPHLPEGGFIANISAVVAERPTKGMAAYSAAKAGLTAFDSALGGELRRRRITVLDIRPTHTETGLAGRPIAGQAPRMPQGHDPSDVADRIVRGIADDEKELAAAAFSA